jgi:hypothetical protein
VCESNPIPGGITQTTVYFFCRKEANEVDFVGGVFWLPGMVVLFGKMGKN